MKINYHLLTIFWVRPNSKANNKINPPTTIDQNGYCYKLAPISAWGTMDIEILHSEVLFKQSISNSIHTIVQRWWFFSSLHLFDTGFCDSILVLAVQNFYKLNTFFFINNSGWTFYVLNTLFSILTEYASFLLDVGIFLLALKYFKWP